MRKRLTFARTLLAPDVPNAGDSVTVLTLTKGGATATVVEISESIDTLVITTDQAGDRASRETLGARSNIAGTEFTLLGSDTLVVVTMTVTIATIAVTTIAMVAFTTLLVIIIAVIIGLSGSPGWGRGFGGGGTGWGRVTTKGARAPVPASATLRRRKGIRWLVRSTAPLSRVPRPVEGAVGVGRRVGGIPRSASGKADILGVPPKTWVSIQAWTSIERTYLNWSFPQPSPWARTKGRAKAKRTMRVMSDISRERTQMKEGVCELGDEPETEKRKD